MTAALYVLSATSLGLMVKDEYDFDGQPQLPPMDGGHSLQTIQHPPLSRVGPPSEPFSTAGLLPLADARTTSAFPSISVGSGSEGLLHHPIHFISPNFMALCILLTQIIRGHRQGLGGIFGYSLSTCGLLTEEDNTLN